MCEATNPDDGEKCVRTVPHSVGSTAVETEHRSPSSYSDTGYSYWHDGWARSRHGNANRAEHWRET